MFLLFKNEKQIRKFIQDYVYLDKEGRACCDIYFEDKQINFDKSGDPYLIIHFKEKAKNIQNN